MKKRVIPGSCSKRKTRKRRSVYCQNGDIFRGCNRVVITSCSGAWLRRRASGSLEPLVNTPAFRTWYDLIFQASRSPSAAEFSTCEVAVHSGVSLPRSKSTSPCVWAAPALDDPRTLWLASESADGEGGALVAMWALLVLGACPSCSFGLS